MLSTLLLPARLSLLSTVQSAKPSRLVTWASARLTSCSSSDAKPLLSDPRLQPLNAMVLRPVSSRRGIRLVTLLREPMTRCSSPREESTEMSDTPVSEKSRSLTAHPSRGARSVTPVPFMPNVVRLDVSRTERSLKAS